MDYMGDFVPGQVVKFNWSTNSKTGGSITRSGNGSLVVYAGSNIAESTAGITDTEDFDSRTGVHQALIDTGAAPNFYLPHEDYQVVLVGSTIDGETVNATLASFSILNRGPTILMEAGVVSGTALTPSATRIQCDGFTQPSARFNRRTLWFSQGSALFREHAVIQTHLLAGGRGDFTFVTPFSAQPQVGDRVLVI